MTNKPWGDAEKAHWLTQQRKKRSYFDDVMPQIEALKQDFEVVQYGALGYDTEYPLFAVKNNNWNPELKTVLVTGGVHGYETSGVHGALLFLQTEAKRYTDSFNLVVLPCISPWGYETINRWNPKTIDPNRSFAGDGQSEESAAVIGFIRSLDTYFIMHIDLHETTDTDNTTFRPALAARDGIEQKNWNIPDGFYVVGDSDNSQPGFQKAIIDSVRQVTHIAPPDDEGKIIGAPLEQEGVINYQLKKLGLCASVTDAEYVSTTEVYPDSPQASPEICNRAQVAAICGGIEYLLQQR